MRVETRRWTRCGTRRGCGAVIATALVIVVIVCFWSPGEETARRRKRDVELLQNCADDKGNSSGSQFPPDAFTLEQRRHGAVLLHLAGLVYMFVALAIVCDEFFVPSLGVLTEKLSISDDVAGATFMAAGGSAPEFFTSMFGVFVAHDNVGIGTIVGSATFNILCVLAFCTIFSREVLHLTWWPLFRDMAFYIVALFLLVIFFADELIMWHEALSMLLIYVLYGFFMKYNEQLEEAVKSRLFHLPHITDDDIPIPPPTLNIRSDSIRSSNSVQGSLHRKSIPFIHGGAQQVRNGILHMAINDDEDTEAEGPADPPAAETNGVRFIQVKPAQLSVGAPRNSSVSSVSSRVQAKDNGSAMPPVDSIKTNGLPLNGNGSSMDRARTPSPRDVCHKPHQHALERALSASSHEDTPLDMKWPDSSMKRLVYLVLAPITFPLYLTLPDTRHHEMRKFFVITFIGSILWIAFFSYLMVWWAAVIGETLGVPTEIMGLTILAAGTSIPDLITSVIVARKGLGDMAVSSSIGSNLFDICIGLPVPWLLFFLVQFLKTGSTTPVSVVSNGLICSVGTLFLMLLVLVSGIAISSWKMDKIFGLVMIVSYAFFCVLSILLETGHVSCPLKIVGGDC